MSGLDMFLVIFLALVAVVGVGAFLYFAYKK